MQEGMRDLHRITVTATNLASGVSVAASAAAIATTDLASGASVAAPLAASATALPFDATSGHI